MAKKLTLTLDKIELDIKNSIGQKRDLSKKGYTAEKIVIAFVGILLGLIAFFLPMTYLYVGLALVVCLFAISGAIALRRYLKKQKVDINDYIISTDILSLIHEENYIARVSKYERKSVDNYSMLFEGGGLWKLPEKNYRWSKEYSMTDTTVSISASKGDTFIIVTKRGTNEIAVAYHTDYFEYNF